MAHDKKPKAVLYARALPPREPDPERYLYLTEKWEGWDKALVAEADFVLVAFPDVLGDTYTELLINLGKLAESGKGLYIKRPSPSLKKEEEVDL